MKPTHPELDLDSDVARRMNQMKKKKTTFPWQPSIKGGTTLEV